MYQYCRQSSFDRTDITIRQQGLTSKGGVTICDDVWIGAHSVILDGVTIGQGSVIAAGAVITKDFMPYSIIWQVCLGAVLVTEKINK